MKEEFDDLKTSREQEDVRNRSAVAEAEEHRKANIRQRRLEGGSRFNLRYSDNVPAEALRPEAVMAALDRYVDFSGLRSAESERPAASISGAPGTLRKGMLLQDADAALGNPLSSAERREGTLKVIQRKYSSPMGLVTAEFVEGVLVRYVLTSE